LTNADLPSLGPIHGERRIRASPPDLLLEKFLHEGGQALSKPIHLSTTGPASDRSPPPLKTRSARWLEIQSARPFKRTGAIKYLVTPVKNEQGTAENPPASRFETGIACTPEDRCTVRRSRAGDHNWPCLNKAANAVALDAILETVTSALTNGETMQLIGYESFLMGARQLAWVVTRRLAWKFTFDAGPEELP
jgi:hypothetical protein